MTDNIARLLALMGAGGSGGTTDYEALTHKPSIGGVTLIGDLTLAELGIIVDDQLNAQSTNPVQNAVLTALLNAFPYANITGKPQINGVTLTGNVTLAELGLNAIWVGTLAEYAVVESTLAEGTVVIITDDQDVDNVPTQSSTNLVYSGGVYAFVTQGLNNKVDKETGKGLSTEDYTTAEKTKLAGLTNDYADHTNKPQINSVTLSGNKSLSDLGIEWVWRGTRAQYEAAAATIPPNTFVEITDESDYATATTAGIVKPDGVTTEVDENGVLSVSTFSPTSWDGVQNIVRAGLASKFFKVRDQLQCMKGNAVLTWDIIGIDQETPTDPLLTHSLTLQLHDCITDLQFSAVEALFAFENGLAAGTYHFTVGQQPWYAGDVGKTIQFTLTQAIPAGGQLVVNNAFNSTMIGATISSYDSGSAATATETITMSEGGDGTDLGTVNNAGNFANGINSIQRALLGSNRWDTSAIRQYLNSDAAAGEVWTPQTVFNRPPTWNENEAGFLNGIDSDFLAVLGSVQKVTALNTVSDGGGTETISEKVFLLSRSEVYAGDEVTGGEGEPYPYYSEYSDLPSAGAGADSNRIKYRNGAAKYWWLRSPSVGYAGYVRSIYATGALSSTVYATYIIGVAPAVAIV